MLALSAPPKEPASADTEEASGRRIVTIMSVVPLNVTVAVARTETVV